MPFDPNKPMNPIEPGGSGQQKPSSDVPLPDDWSQRVMEAHNGWIRCPYGFRAEHAKKAKLSYTPGQVARPVVAGWGSVQDFAIRPFMVLDADGNILLSIKAIGEDEYTRLKAEQDQREQSDGEVNV